ncbi:hypothetical protein KEM56_001007 [Ascosphaera pollenicola]|nr:hypothetical protein KEM56_001007 [Ascosphaera pollenicola]
MALATAAAATAGSSALLAYLNAKYHLSKDLGIILNQTAALSKVTNAISKGEINGYYHFAEAARKYPDTVCLWSRDGVYTFKEVHEKVSQWGHYFQSLGVARGDLVALYLLNCPEFPMAWLALWSIGAAPALINANLGGMVLVHCLRVSEAKVLLYDGEKSCAEKIHEEQAKIQTELGMTAVPLDAELKRYIYRAFPTTPTSDSLRRATDPGSPCGLFYTSGTTGMPKAVGFTMQRIVTTSFVSLAGKTPGPKGDRWYNCMPFYHGTGGVCLMTSMLTGVGIAMGKKFSVSRFWKDCVDSKATMIVYVGETARYLLLASPSDLDRAHRVRCAWGNGMRPDVWEKFQERFGVRQIDEFFNSTEGMLVLENTSTGPYSAFCVGHHGALMRRRLNDVYIPVAIDADTGDIWRDPKTGFAKRTSYEEGGEILVALPHEKAFAGYWKNPEATNKKLISDVFKKGDVFYRSGDALRRDADGHWFFLDRLGDTFRWKSENVSTAEVGAVLGTFPGVNESNVYGVSVPGYEGRAGCAALLLEQSHQDSFDFEALARNARRNLPKYAVPVFLRILSPTESDSMHTSNNKQNKVPLREEGIDPAKMGTKIKLGQHDRMMWLPPNSDTYVDFGKEEWEKLSKGLVRL